MEIKKILFKLGVFPLLSETFILNQILLAIECGLDVEILVNDFTSITESKQSFNFEKYKLEEKIIHKNYNIPKHKFHRVIKWFWLLVVNVYDIKYILKFHILKFC